MDDFYYTNANDYDVTNYIDTHFITASGLIGKKRRIPLSARNKSRIYHSVHTATDNSVDAATDAMSDAVIDLIDMKLKLALESFKNEIIAEQEQRMREIAKQSYQEFTSDSDSSDSSDDEED